MFKYDILVILLLGYSTVLSCIDGNAHVYAHRIFTYTPVSVRWLIRGQQYDAVKKGKAQHFIFFLFVS